MWPYSMWPWSLAKWRPFLLYIDYIFAHLRHAFPPAAHLSSKQTKSPRAVSVACLVPLRMADVAVTVEGPAVAAGMSEAEAAQKIQKASRKSSGSDESIGREISIVSLSGEVIFQAVYTSDLTVSWRRTAKFGGSFYEHTRARMYAYNCVYMYILTHIYIYLYYIYINPFCMCIWHIV